MHPLWEKGFRPFFSGAALLALVSVPLWLAFYLHGGLLKFNTLSPVHWHAHEMVFGYVLAVVAGFLLTAAANWTGRETLAGRKLAVLFGLWAAARVLMLAGDRFVALAALADLAFLLYLSVAVISPIAAVRQRRQWPVVLLLLLFLAANAGFYGSVLMNRPGWTAASLTGGFYLVLGLVLFMGSRVIPFFTGRGVGYEFTPVQRRWADVFLSIAYVLFALIEWLLPLQISPPSETLSLASQSLAAIICVLVLLRLSGWYTHGIWKKPLLWSLHLSFALVALGFFLRALPVSMALSPFIVLHVFAVGGIGLATLSMMTRVSLGHTGRSVHEAPGLALVFLFTLLTAFALRVVFPLIWPHQYPWWIALSGLAWALSFALFVVAFLPKLVQARADSD